MPSLDLVSAHKKEFADQQNKLLQWIKEIEESFEDRIFHLDQKVIWKWGELCGLALRNGNQLTVIDSLIAATALTNGLVLVTRNIDDFPDSVSTYNPW
jgi:predicted nucleic acid-binding protein